MIPQQNITKVLGVDIFLEAPLSVKLPPQIGAFKLKHVASRGTALGGPSVAEILDVGWVCARYLFEKPDNNSNDAEITTLMTTLGKDYRWSSILKLYEINGSPAFT